MADGEEMTRQNDVGIPGEGQHVYTRFFTQAAYQTTVMTPEAGLLPAGSSHRLSGVQPVPRLFPSGCLLKWLAG